MLLRRFSFALAAALALAAPAVAADLPVKAPPAPAAAYTASGLYVGVFGSFAKTNAEVNFVSIPLQSGNLSPAGAVAGGVVGWGTWLSPGLYAGVEGDVGNDFTKNSIPCVVVMDCTLKHSLTASGSIIVGVTPAGITGAATARGLAPASQWPIPISVPTSFSSMQNLMIYGKLGVVGDDTKACVTGITVIAGCSDRFIIGARMGGGVRMPILANVNLDISVLYDRFNKDFIPASTAVIFPTQFKQFSQTSGRAALLFGF
jgi:opacity protein-like surface antigen